MSESWTENRNLCQYIRSFIAHELCIPQLCHTECSCISLYPSGHCQNFSIDIKPGGYWSITFILICFSHPCQTSSLSLRGILQLLRQDAANSPHRRRRPRFVRRAVRRMRRWGLIPRPPSRPSQPSTSGQQQSDTAPSGQETSHSAAASSSSAVEALNQPVRQKLGLLTQSEQQQQASPPPLQPPVASTPPPPYAPPAPPPVTPHTLPVAVPPSSPSLASIFHTLGLSISLFRASPSSTNSMPLSTSPSFSSSSSDDDVLLIPLSEDTTSEDDVPMLTWMSPPLLANWNSVFPHVFKALHRSAPWRDSPSLCKSGAF